MEVKEDEILPPVHKQFEIPEDEGWDYKKERQEAIDSLKKVIEGSKIRQNLKIGQES